MLEQHIAEEQLSNRPRALRRRTTDDIVQKSIADNCKDFDQISIDGVKVDGLTLRDRLKRDKHLQKKDNNLKTGALYYRELRYMYAGAAHPSNQLVARGPKEVVSTRLHKALVACKQANSNKLLLSEWLQTEPTCNQKELVGILKIAASLKPTVSLQQQQLLIETMRFLKRTGMTETFKEDVDLMQDIWGSGLSAAWAALEL